MLAHTMHAAYTARLHENDVLHPTICLLFRLPVVELRSLTMKAIRQVQAIQHVDANLGIVRHDCTNEDMILPALKL